LNELIYERRHRAQRIFSGHRRPNAQRELLNGLLICDVLGRPWLQVPLRGLARSLDPLARGLLAFASEGDVAHRSLGLRAGRYSGMVRHGSFRAPFRAVNKNPVR